MTATTDNQPASELLKPAVSGSRDRIFKRLLYDSGFVASKALYEAVSELKDKEGMDLGAHLGERGLITKGQLKRLRTRTRWYFCKCPAAECGRKYEINQIPQSAQAPCPRCTESIVLPERNLLEGKLMILKPRKIKAMVLGKLAMKMGFLDKDQLEQCFEIHGRSTKNKQLAQVMIDEGFLPGERVGELLNEHNKIIESMEGYFRKLVREIQMIDKMIAEGVVGTREMNRAIEQQSRTMAAGKTEDLLDVLVEHGTITQLQREMIDAGNTEKMYHCPGCNQLYLLRNPEARRRFICKKCGQMCGGEAEPRTMPPQPAKAVPAQPQPLPLKTAVERPAIEESSGTLVPVSAGDADESSAVTVQPISPEDDGAIVELQPLAPGESVEDLFPEPVAPDDWDKDVVVDGDSDAEEPDPADFLDEDFMVSDHLEAVDAEALAEYREKMETQDDAAKVPALDPAGADSGEIVMEPDEPTEAEKMQAQIDKLTRELDAQKAALEKSKGD